MGSLNAEMIEILSDLKKNHHVKGIKISFEDEGLTGELAQIITSISQKAGVHISMKIGGCEAKKDIHDAKVLGVEKIVAPMIETAYAMKKFVEAIRAIYSEEERAEIGLYINIETITGYNNLEEILSQPEAKDLSGVVLGRSDFVGSLKKDKNFVNSDEMLNYALNIEKTCQKYGKKLYIGGNISGQSKEFLTKIPASAFCGLETRNVIFDYAVLQDVNFNNHIEKALNFELCWLKLKSKFYIYIVAEDTKRIDALQKRLCN